MKKIIILFSTLVLFFVSTGYKTEIAGYEVGDKINDFKLKNIDGKTVSLASNEAAKGYIVIVTCNTCPVSKAYEERIISLDKKYKSQGYPVIAINPNDSGISPGDSFEAMKVRAKEKSFTFPYLFDETQDVAKSFGAKSTPTAYIVTKKGDDFILVYKGAIDNDKDEKGVTIQYVENAMAEIRERKDISTSSTKAVGCGIKWKKA